MEIMQGTTLHDLDLTDSDTLLSYFFWFVKQNGTKSKDKIVYRDGKPYKVLNDASWA